MTPSLRTWKGDYAGLAFISSRGVCQVKIEFPLEEGTKFVEAFGTPIPKSNVQVAIALLDPNTKPEHKGGKLAQKAGILCSEKAFWEFLETTKGYPPPLNSEEAAISLRLVCGVESRADLDHDEAAARKFRDLEASYRAWLTVDA